MYEGQFQTWQDDPDNIHDYCDDAARRFGFPNFPAEWRHAQQGQLETLDSEWYPDDGDTQNNAAQDVSQGDKESAKDKPEYVEYE